MDCLLEDRLKEVRHLDRDLAAERGRGLSRELDTLIHVCAKELARLRTMRGENARYHAEILFPGSNEEALLYRIPYEICGASDLTMLLARWTVEELLPEERQRVKSLPLPQRGSGTLCLLTLRQGRGVSGATVSIGDAEQVFAARGITPATLGELLGLDPVSLESCNFPKGHYLLVSSGSRVSDGEMWLSPYLQYSAGRCWLHFGQRGWPEHTYFVGVEHRA